MLGFCKMHIDVGKRKGAEFRESKPSSCLDSPSGCLTLCGRLDIPELPG